MSTATIRRNRPERQGEREKGELTNTSESLSPTAKARKILAEAGNVEAPAPVEDEQAEDE